MVDLLQPGFSEAAVREAIKGDDGGPYVAEESLGEAVRVLRAAGFSQKQLDCLLGKGNAFKRSPADLSANLAWLRQQFGLSEQQLALACTRSHELLTFKLATLHHKWAEVECTYKPTPAAKRKLAAALRSGRAEFIGWKAATVRCGLPSKQPLFASGI
jgi:hypothetical protein